MAKVTGQNIPNDIRPQFFEALQFDYSNGGTRVILKNRATGRVRARAIANRSPFVAYSPGWRGLSYDDKTTWANYPRFYNSRYFSRYVQNNQNRWKLFLPEVSVADTTPGFCGFYQKMATESSASVVFEIADGETKRTEYRTKRKYFMPEVKHINHATDIFAGVLFWCKNVTHSGDARIRVLFTRTWHNEANEYGVDANEIALTIGAGGETAYSNMPFVALPSRFATTGLRIEIKLAGHAGDFILGNGALSCYNDGVTYRLTNTDHFQDIGATYSGKFSGVAPDWNVNNMGSGDTFASALPAFFGYDSF